VAMIIVKFSDERTGKASIYKGNSLV